MRRFELSAAVLGAAFIALACTGRPAAKTRSAPPPGAASSSASSLALAPVLAAPTPAGPRVYVKNRYVFVRSRPDASADWIGFLWFGASVALRETAPIRGRGCATFYAIEPRGYVCVDEQQATLAADDALFQLVSKYAPRLDRPSPHQYAESRGSELLTALPGSDRRWPALPRFFHEPRRHLLPLSTIAYLEEDTEAGQRWLLSADLLWVKAEQVKPYPEITFHGVELGRGVELPVAFFRDPGVAKYRRVAAGRFERTEQRFELHALLELRSAFETQHGQRYFQALRGDDWLREVDAVLPEARSITPWGARVGQDDHTGRAPNNARQTWLEVSVMGGWLLAFEGTKPVYATLVSPGRGGIASAGTNPLDISATPSGIFPISGKLATVTLEAPGEYVHSEVPWTQNFKKPYAIHTAYWHDNWGHLQSGGCINVSPKDGKWLFDFSEPPLPAGWHAVRWQESSAAPTLLVVHE